MKLLTIIVTTFLMIGCTSIVHKPFDIEKSSLAIDAKQRVIISGERDGERIVCAEPNPDIFYGNSLKTDLGVKSSIGSPGSVNVGTGYNESVVEISNRSKVVTLLRDGMYRACEAYMNGAIGVAEYKMILTKQDDMLLTLVAVEQLGKLYGTKNQSDIFDSENDEAANAIYKIVHEYLCLQSEEISDDTPSICSNN